MVPAYLQEDHPTEFPENAKNLVKKVGETKGNGMPAEQLDLELSILFRNADQRGPKKKQKRREEIEVLSSDSDDEQMKQWVAKEKANIEERNRKRILR